MKILIPVDGSENSMRAVSYALKMVKAHADMEITLLAVACWYSDYNLESVLTANKINSECEKHFSFKLEEAKRIFKDQGVPVNAVLMQGDPASVIIHYVEENDIDKIIIGSRGLGLLKAAAVGSVTYKVLHNVEIPVTVIK